MAAPRTILKARHSAWERLGGEKRVARQRLGSTSVEDLLCAGQRLSAQAAALRRSVSHDGRPVRP